MTIKELENRTGMTRANIRFYEGEGLISPKRLENGYRDYSEEDVQTLEKIKLLRQLQLDIDTIRKIQGGALSLEQALFSQLTKLEGDKAVIERAAEVCRELQQTCVEYAALEPQPWLWKLEAPQRPQFPEIPPAALPEEESGGSWDGEPQACYHPWRRYFARTLDVFLYDTLINVLWLVLLHDLSLWEFQTNTIGGLVFGLAMLALALAAEPLWLHFVGWTPGKFLFGLKLRDENGEKLSIAQGWERSWRVFQDGYGWYIPIWNLWKMWQCRTLGLDGRDCWWDAEEDYRYTKVERRFSVGVVYVLVTLVLFAAQMLALQGAQMPIHQGDLTVAEFCQNFNQYHRQFRYSDAEPRLDENGHWTIRTDGNVQSITSSYAFSSSDGTMREIQNVVEGTAVWSDPEFTLTEGRVTAVTFHWESRDSLIWPFDGPHTSLCLLAMSGAVDGLNVFRYDLADWLTQLSEHEPPNEAIETDGQNGRVDWEAEIRGLRLHWQVEYSGYELNLAGGFLVCVDDETPLHYEKTVTISLIE